jgi:hypothetical protein
MLFCSHEVKVKLGIKVEMGASRVECGVWSVEFGVWSVEFGVWSVECDASRGQRQAQRQGQKEANKILWVG